LISLSISFHLFLYQIENQILFQEISGSSVVLSIFIICKSKNVGIVYDVVAVLSDNKTSRHPVILLVVVIIVQASGVPDKPAFIRYVFVVHEGICQSCHIFVDEFISLLSKES